MAVKAGTAYVQVEGDFSHLNRQVASNMGRLSRQGQAAGHKFGKSFGSGLTSPLKAATGALGAAFATKKLVDFGKDAVGVASDINESLSKNQVLFGKYAKGVEK